jgi:hypothetical protein
MTKQFSELRKWLECEIQNEARTAGDVNRSETMQLLAMSKVTAYHRVIRKMDENMDASILSGVSWADVDTSAISGLATTGVSGSGIWQRNRLNQVINKEVSDGD